MNKVLEILKTHAYMTADYTTPRQYTQHGGWNQSCVCGEHLCSHEMCDCFERHVSAMLTPVLEDAWSSGYAAGLADANKCHDETTAVNPYTNRNENEDA